MAKQIRVRGVRRKQIDEDKLALAFLLLAKTICEQETTADADTASAPTSKPDDQPEAA